jgi:hypothetical protein
MIDVGGAHRRAVNDTKRTVSVACFLRFASDVVTSEP